MVLVITALFKFEVKRKLCRGHASFSDFVNLTLVTWSYDRLMRTFLLLVWLIKKHSRVTLPVRGHWTVRTNPNPDGSPRRSRKCAAWTEFMRRTWRWAVRSSVSLSGCVLLWKGGKKSCECRGADVEANILTRRFSLVGMPPLPPPAPDASTWQLLDFMEPLRSH